MREKPPPGGFLLPRSTPASRSAIGVRCQKRRQAAFLLAAFCYKKRITQGNSTMSRRALALPLIALLGLAGPASADTLLIERAQEKPAAAAPVRGQTAADVEARFGAPQQKLEPRGGQKRQWPVIHRWVYPGFTVYFEKSRVIDVVLNQASADEIGPKPPIR
jgi:hypothetical protein